MTDNDVMEMIRLLVRSKAAAQRIPETYFRLANTLPNVEEVQDDVPRMVSLIENSVGELVDVARDYLETVEDVQKHIRTTIDALREERPDIFDNDDPLKGIM